MTDGTNLVSQLFTLNITEVDDPLIAVNSPTNLTVEKGDPLSETIVYTDEDDAVNYQLMHASMTCDEMPWATGLAIDFNTGVLSGVTDFAGVCTVQVLVMS